MFLMDNKKTIAFKEWISKCEGIWFLVLGLEIVCMKMVIIKKIFKMDILFDEK